MKRGTTAGPHNAIPSNLLGVGSLCGLGPDLVGIHSISLAARNRVAACSTTLSQGLEKIRTVRGHNNAPIFALSPVREKEFLAPSMACRTANAFDIVCRLDRDGKLDEVSQNKKQQIVTGLLVDNLHKQDFARPLSSRASKVLGPISRYRVADILPHMKLVSLASRPGLIVGFLRILCNGLCTAQRFHTEEHDHTCRVGCSNEPLSHYNECPRLYNIFASFWRHDTVVPQRNHFLHDLFTRCSCEALPIISTVVLSKILALWRLYVGTNPLYDGHHSCLRPRSSGNLSRSTHAWDPASTFPPAPAQGQIHRGTDFRGWAICADGGTRIVNVETLAGWGVISRSPLGRIHIMFGPVTTEAHLAVSGAKTHSNNTAEMTAMVEALSFLGPPGQVARDEQACISSDSQHGAGVCLGTIEARTKKAGGTRMSTVQLCAQHRLRLTMQHVYGHSGNLGDACVDHAAALGTFGRTSSHNVATRCCHPLNLY